MISLTSFLWFLSTITLFKLSSVYPNTYLDLVEFQSSLVGMHSTTSAVANRDVQAAMVVISAFQPSPLWLSDR
jgi:hypothetical protein